MNIISDAWYKAYVEQVHLCQACSSRKEANVPVAGVGNLKARVVFLGRNPGITENKEGIPFVGNAGVVFDKFLKRSGLLRESVFITNLTLCHTYKNRMQNDHEVLTCVKLFLLDTIKMIKPELLVVFGKLPNLWINNVEEVEESNGRLFYHKSLKCFTLVSIHPSYVCYNKSKQKNLDKVGDVMVDFLRGAQDENL